MGAIRFSADPGLIRLLAAELPLDVFVETGTYEGDSVRAARPFFNEIHSIELSDELYERVETVFSKQKGIHLHHGKSQDLLKKLVPKLKDRGILYWLDAHWSGEGGSAAAEQQCPLLEELTAIGSLGKDSVVLIDDARLFLSPPPEPARAEQWPEFGQVLDALTKLSKNHELLVVDDVIVFYPPPIKESLREYARDNATDWLAELQEARTLNARLQKVEFQLESLPDQIQQTTTAQVKSVSVGLTPQLEAIQLGMADLNEGSKAIQEALSGARVAETREGIKELEERVDQVTDQLLAIQKGMADLNEGSKAIQEAIGARVEAGRDEGLAAEVSDLRSHVEEVQRLLMVAAEEREEKKERDPVRAPRWVVAVFVRPWQWIGGKLSASRQHWAVRLQRLRMEPKLGRLEHHEPMELEIPERYVKEDSPDDPPSISVVTPSFNQAFFLEDTIESVAGQGYPNLEYIVQDGGSTDGTREVLERNEERIHHWASEEDAGQGNAINLGFAHASGEIMGYLNSDDLLLPGTLNYVGRYFAKHPKVDVIYGHRVLVDEAGSEIGRWVLPRHRDGVLSWADYIPQETLFWRREIWDAAGAQMNEDFRFALDWDLVLRFRDAGAKIVRVPRFLGAFRIHGESKTNSQLNSSGAEEMALIRAREHDREVTSEEVDKRIRGYLRRHVALHKLYRAGVIRY